MSPWLSWNRISYNIFLDIDKKNVIKYINANHRKLPSISSKCKHDKLLLVGKFVDQFLEWGEFTFVDETEFLHKEDEMFE